MSEIQSTRKTNFNDLKQPGDFMFTGRQGVDGHAGILFVCPCGCGELGSLSFDNAIDDHPKWTWNGSEDKPTLAPSIAKTTGCKWHGYLTDGVFCSC